MTRRSSLVVALIVAAVAGISAGVAQLGLLNEGVQFPDGTVQTSAAETPGDSVQASVSFEIPEFEFCALGTLYTVPMRRNLRIEWVTAEILATAAAQAPVEIDLRTWLDGVQEFHALVRLGDPINFGISLFHTQRWSSPALLHAEGDTDVEVFACRASDAIGGTHVIVTFHGQLFDA